MVDYNQCLTPAEAVERLRVLDDEGLTWVEEPTLAHDYAGHALVAREAQTPIQCGENWWGTLDLQHALDAGASDYVMPDVMKIGGVTGWLRAAALAGSAQASGSRTTSGPRSARSCCAVTPTAHWLEYADWWNPILAEPLRIEDGAADVSEVPSAPASSGTRRRSPGISSDARSTLARAAVEDGRRPAEPIHDPARAAQRCALRADSGSKYIFSRFHPHGPADQHITVGGEVVEDLLAHREQPLDADERRPEATDVEALERLWLVELDVHRHEVDRRHMLRVEQVVQRDRRHLADFLGHAELPDELLVSRARPGPSAGAGRAWPCRSTSRRRTAGRISCAAGTSRTRRRTPSAARWRSRTTQLRFEVVGLAGTLVVIGPDVHEGPALAILEVVPDQPFLLALGEVIGTVLLAERPQFAGAHYRRFLRGPAGSRWLRGAGRRTLLGRAGAVAGSKACARCRAKSYHESSHAGAPGRGASVGPPVIAGRAIVRRGRERWQGRKW